MARWRRLCAKSPTPPGVSTTTTCCPPKAKATAISISPWPAFHVSPFLPRDLEYRMSFSPPAERLGVHMSDWQGELKMFDATLNLQRQALSRNALHRYLLAYPWMTAKTCLAIYWQALRLLIKRVPIFSHQAAEGAYQTAAVQVKEKRHEKQ